MYIKDINKMIEQQSNGLIEYLYLMLLEISNFMYLVFN
jgi:hypothetical protein